MDLKCEDRIGEVFICHEVDQIQDHHDKLVFGVFVIIGVGSVQDPFHCGLCGWLRVEVKFDQ